MSVIATFDFIVLCAKEKENSSLLACLEGIKKLATASREIRVFMVPITKESRYIEESMPELVAKFCPLTLELVRGHYEDTSEPRAFNYGLSAALARNTGRFIVFLYETDIILSESLLDYYLWLFESAHNPDIIGAVSFSTNTLVSRIPEVVKMYYSDDVFLRGTCYRQEAIRATGPFDETFLYRSFEFDFSSRMTHHAHYLVRIGKEGEGRSNRFIQLGPADLCPSFEKVSAVKRQCLIWIAKKWHTKGIWQSRTTKQLTPQPEQMKPNCFINADIWEKTESNFPDIDGYMRCFGKRPGVQEERALFLFSDAPTIKAIDASPAFMKKPFANYKLQEIIVHGPIVHNNPDILIDIACEVTYPDTLWNAQGVH